MLPEALAVKYVYMTVAAGMFYAVAHFKQALKADE